MSSGIEFGTFERRYIGECSWCGAGPLLIRDYMCYDPLNPCCHDLYRQLPGKVGIALRAFPSRVVDTKSQFNELAEEFRKCFMNDRRYFEKHKEQVERIEEFQGETGGELIDFFRFLLRLYILRGKVVVKGTSDLIKQSCAVCGSIFEELQHMEICRTCIGNLGATSDDFDLSPSEPQPDEQKAPPGMYVMRRRKS